MVLPASDDEYAFIADLYDHVGPYRDRGDIRFFELIYYVTHPDGREERLVHAFTMRYLFRFEAEHLLARAGFQIEHLYADYDKSAYGSKYPGELLFVARKVRR